MFTTELVVEREPEVKLLYPYNVSDDEIHDLYDEVKKESTEYEDAMWQVSQHLGNFSVELLKYDDITHDFANEFRFDDTFQLRPEQFTQLAIDYISPYPERKKRFKETFPKLRFFDINKEHDVVDESFFAKRIALWTRVLNLMAMRKEPNNIEFAMLAAGFADRSPSNSWELLHGLGRTASGKPYAPLVYRIKELPDFEARGHTSVVELIPPMLSVDFVTRYDLFLFNSIDNAEFRGSEEKSGRDVPLLVHIIPEEFKGVEKVRRGLEELTSSLKELYEIDAGNGKKLPKEDVRYAALMCARTSTTFSTNPFNLSQALAYAASDNLSRTVGYRKFLKATSKTYAIISPTFAPEAERAGIASGYTARPKFFEELFPNVDIEHFTDPVIILNVRSPIGKIEDIQNPKDPALKTMSIEYLFRGSASMAAQHMRHNYGTQFFESLLHAGDRWEIVEPPSIKAVEKASKIFNHAAGIARDLFNDHRYFAEAAAYFVPLGTEVLGYANLNGYADINFQLQRTDDGAQWEIRKLARTKHNKVESTLQANIDGNGLYTRLIGHILEKYATNGSAYRDPDGRIRFDLGQVKTKSGV